MPSSEDDITVAEVAEMVGVTPRAIAAAISRGSLIASRKLPGRTGAYLIDVEEARRYAELTRKTVQAAPADEAGAA